MLIVIVYSLHYFWKPIISSYHHDYGQLQNIRLFMRISDDSSCWYNTLYRNIYNTTSTNRQPASLDNSIQETIISFLAHSGYSSSVDLTILLKMFKQLADANTTLKVIVRVCHSSFANNIINDLGSLTSIKCWCCTKLMGQDGRRILTTTPPFLTRRFASRK